MLRPFLIVSAVISVLTYGVLPWFYGDTLRDLVDAFGQVDAAGGNDSLSTPLWVELTPALSSFGLIATFLKMVWAYLAAVAGRALLVPARRRPILVALSFILPIVGWWWPYQGVAATIPRSERRSVPLRSWWAAVLLSQFVGLAALIASWWSSVTGGIIGASAAILAIASYALLWRITVRIAAIHNGMVTSPAEVPTSTTTAEA